MNGRKAKALRAEARLKTIGLPYRNHVNVPQLSPRHENYFQTELGQCTRAAYKFLKIGRPTSSYI